MARKRRRRLGHITAEENQKVREALDEATRECYERYSSARDQRSNACVVGVVKVEDSLEKRGFKVTSWPPRRP